MITASEDFVYVRHWISRSEHPDIRHWGFIGYCQVPQGIIIRDLQVSSRKICGHHSCRGKQNKPTQQTNQPVGITGAQLRGGHRADGAAQPASSSSAP